MKLLDSDDDEDAEKATNSLEINKNYAERYENWRRLEELQKIKDKYGDNLDDTSSSDDEPEWSAADEMQFLKTLSALKDNNSAIYDGASSFWQDNGDEAGHSEKPKKKDRKAKPMYLKDYERKLILEKGGQIDESGDEDDHKDPNYFEQQEQIRKELRRVVESNEGEGDSDESDELLVPKMKTKEEKVY
ncbi:hypothetical protein TELCIR_11909 [Teladorsagia circumcincta]|uniref:KRI1-like family protein n=1 Tax=Teladorsagia circumcincta TaxID=45464 RepID=A0A2G9U7Y2_TELCI|nr:hypothetical protein TELCIR_11909 [Teladorsagia circumcincta]